MEIEVAFRLSRSEYVRALRFCLRKRHLVSWIQLLTIAVALALAVVMARVMERVSVLCTMLFVLAVMLAVYSLYQYLLKPGRIFDRDPMLHREVRFRFNGRTSPGRTARSPCCWTGGYRRSGGTETFISSLRGRRAISFCLDGRLVPQRRKNSLNAGTGGQSRGGMEEFWLTIEAACARMPSQQREDEEE